jgi:hypothetical protein
MNWKIWLPTAIASIIPWGFVLQPFGVEIQVVGISVQVIGLSAMFMLRKKIWGASS